MTLSEQLQDACKRIHASLNRRKEFIKTLEGQEKKEQEYEYAFYQGKLYAYLTCLEGLGERRFVNAMRQVRGFHWFNEKKSKFYE